MKCKRHPCEGGVGVCASCLRDRLLTLEAAQNALSPPPSPPRLDFPRSVSPYLSRRRMLAADDPVPGRHLQRFYSTPQGRGVGPKRFSILSALFGNRRSGKIEPDLDDPSGSGAGSWFSALLRRRRRTVSDPPAATRNSYRPGDRGMSPVRNETDSGDECDSSSGDEAEFQLPGPTPSRNFPAKGRNRGVSMSGLVVCLSPLVRASPNRWRCPAVEGVLVASDGRSNHRHVSGGTGMARWPNRSRKLADFGRFR